MQIFPVMRRERLLEILDSISGVRVGLLGDLCLDVYWRADMRLSELSRETPHFPLPVVEERTSPGAGGNVAANMAALGPASVRAMGIVGDDWRGAELMHCFEAAGIDATGVVHGEGIVTNAYCKPLRGGISKLVYEDPRLDFENREPLPLELEQALLKIIDDCVHKVDVLCVSDQFGFGAVTPRVREKLAGLGAQGLRVLVDSRDRIGEFTNVMLKPNELEGARAAGLAPANLKAAEDFADAAQALAMQKDTGVFMTIGSLGSLYATPEGVCHIESRDIAGPLDIVGAGDCFLSGLGTALACGATGPEAAFFAGLCSEVTIQQMGTTGTANRQQVLARFDEAYVL